MFVGGAYGGVKIYTWIVGRRVVVEGIRAVITKDLFRLKLIELSK